MSKINIMGLNFDDYTLDEFTNLSIKIIENKEKAYVITPNAEIGYRCFKDEKLKTVINSGKFVLPDGVGVVYASKILKKAIKTKIAGIVYGEKMLEKLSQTNGRVFFLGSKPNVAQTAADNMIKKYPNLNIVGVKDGYFKDDSEAISAINNIGDIDLLFVCLGVPRQEFFVFDNFDKIDAKIMCCLGGSLDVFAGTVKRAPDIFIKLNLEWFYRLIKEPKRFVRMLALPKYIIMAIAYRLKIIK